MGSLKWAAGYIINSVKPTYKLGAFLILEMWFTDMPLGLPDVIIPYQCYLLALLKLSNLYHRLSTSYLITRVKVVEYNEKKISFRLLEKEINFHNFSRFSIANR